MQVGEKRKFCELKDMNKLESAKRQKLLDDKLLDEKLLDEKDGDDELCVIVCYADDNFGLNTTGMLDKLQEIPPYEEFLAPQYEKEYYEEYLNFVSYLSDKDGVTDNMSKEDLSTWMIESFQLVPMHGVHGNDDVPVSAIEALVESFRLLLIKMSVRYRSVREYTREYFVTGVDKIVYDYYCNVEMEKVMDWDNVDDAYHCLVLDWLQLEVEHLDYVNTIEYFGGLERCAWFINL